MEGDVFLWQRVETPVDPPLWLGAPVEVNGETPGFVFAVMAAQDDGFGGVWIGVVCPSPRRRPVGEEGDAG